MSANPQPSIKARSPWLFFLIITALAVPLWLAGERLGVIAALRIPASDLALAFVPMMAALGLVAAREGWRAAGGLLKAAFDFRSVRGWRWRAATVLVAPSLYLATSLAMQAVGGADPAPISPVRLAVLFGLFLVLAAGEEVGWTGYALDPLKARWGPLGASLILAVPWWLGHLPSMREIGATAGDVAWWGLAAIALRIVVTWLYDGAGRSLCAAVVFHALLNLSRIVAYPAEGSHYDSAYQAVGSAIAAILAVGLVWRVSRMRRFGPVT